MAVILGIETSTDICSVAISINETDIRFIEQSNHNVHAEKLTVFIEKLLIENKITPDKVDAVAVSIGPGSFTGLRIGVSTAKGICYAAGIPIIAVNSLEIIAKAFLENNLDLLNDNTLICPMIDARRMEVYYSIFDRNLKTIEATSSIIIDNNNFHKYLTDYEIVFTGNGSEKAKGVINHINAKFQNRYSSAKYLVQLALKKYENKNFEDLAYFEPFYLKEFIAIPPKNKIITI
ncbi:MAG: tRNA (adenosine(37)-N6)-threonylcarbamoyltransferase complex dimerization subunit type 1 TsaB [Bacteroidota bacterium]